MPATVKYIEREEVGTSGFALDTVAVAHTTQQALVADWSSNDLLEKVTAFVGLVWAHAIDQARESRGPAQGMGEPWLEIKALCLYDSGHWPRRVKPGERGRWTERPSALRSLFTSTDYANESVIETAPLSSQVQGFEGSCQVIVSEEADKFLAQNATVSEILSEGLRKLRDVFGSSISPRISLVTDPSDGFQRIAVVIQSAESNERMDRLMARFNHEWWYQRILDAQGTIFFRVARGGL